MRKAARHALVHKLRAAGASYKEIAAKVGVNNVTIWKYLKTPEVVVPPRRQLSLERQDVARRMKQEGATYAQIGERFGVSAQSVCELVRDGAPQMQSGVCPVCSQQRGDLVPHHTDYIKDETMLVCRACHMKLFHPDATAVATAASANKRRKPPRVKIGRIGPPPRLLNGKTAKEMAVIWGVGLTQAQHKFAQQLGPRWVRRDKRQK